MSEHKIGIIGFGGMAKYHFDMLKKDNFKRAVYKGVYDINSAKYELAKERGLLIYDSFDDMLSDDEIDIILSKQQ